MKRFYKDTCGTVKEIIPKFRLLRKVVARFTDKENVTGIIFRRTKEEAEGDPTPEPDPEEDDL